MTTGIIHRRVRFFIFLGLSVGLYACLFTQSNSIPTMTLIPTETQEIRRVLPTQTTFTPLHSTPTLTADVPVPEISPDLVRQGAAFGMPEGIETDEVAVGLYQPAAPDCGTPWLTSVMDESTHPVLTLQYRTPLNAQWLEIYTSDPNLEIRRVEVLYSRSGLGWMSGERDVPFELYRQEMGQGACTQRLLIPVNPQAAVDTVILEFDDWSALLTIDAVHILGTIEAYTHELVYWRVLLPDTPVDISLSQTGLLYVAAGDDGLFTYDVEGNLLHQFSVPEHTQLSGVASDASGNLVVLDRGYGWFVLFEPPSVDYPNGHQFAAGGEGLSGQIAVSPLDRMIYVLDSGVIHVYAGDSFELQRTIILDETQSYNGLAFDPTGYLYTLQNFNWDAVVLVLDPVTGEEVDAFPLVESDWNEIVAQDLAVDGQGNIYVLFSMNTADIAIHVYTPQGSLLKRFAVLSSEPDGWPEGAFLDPQAISVSPDGRFVFVADGFDQSAFLTAFLMEIEE